MNNRILPLYIFLIFNISLVANSTASPDWSSLSNYTNPSFSVSNPSHSLVIPPTCEGEFYYYIAPIWRDNDKDNPRSVYISTTYDRTEVSIMDASASINIDTFITSGAIHPISFDNVLSNDINTIKADVGLIIRTSTPVQIRFSIENKQNASITAFKGKDALGTAFRIATQTGTTVDFSKEQVHFASVIATEDNTTITFNNNGDDFRGLGVSTHVIRLVAR